jgi:phosphoglycolate phosphatase-like HAD superfamily hydrolase
MIHFSIRYDARVQTLQQALTASNITYPTGEMFLKSSRGNLREALMQHQATREIALDLLENFRRAYWTKKAGLISIYPGVRLMLERLSSHGLKLGILTQKLREVQVAGYRAGALMELEETGIVNMFSGVVGFEDVEKPKPHPQGVNIALSHLGISPDDTLVVGDSIADIEAGRAAGCHTCHATWGISLEDKQKDLHADFIVDNPETVCKLILL